jgi:hypothetical protein
MSCSQDNERARGYFEFSKSRAKITNGCVDFRDGSGFQRNRNEPRTMARVFDKFFSKKEDK